MGKYTPRYNDRAIDTMSDIVNISGESPQTNVIIEESEQRRIAESDMWYLARLNNKNQDTRKRLESLGFEVSICDDALFYEVIAPLGWSKNTNGLWTTVCDEYQVVRMLQFFKGAHYDRRTHLDFSD